MSIKCHKFIKLFDLYSAPMQLTYQGARKFGTNWGGCKRLASGDRQNGRVTGQDGV